MPEGLRVYTVGDFVVPSNGHEPVYVPSSGSIELRPDAQPPAEKFGALMAADKTFQKTWDRTRQDLTDFSASGWDMAFVNIVVQLGWTDQEITNLLISSRRKHGDDMNLDREDYYRLTIQKVRIQRGDLQAIIGADASTEAGRDGRLAFLAEHFGASVLGLTRHPGPPDSYVLKTETGGMSVKSTDILLSAPKMRSLWLQHTGFVLPAFKPALWTSIVQALIDVCQDDVIADQTESGRIDSWVEGYIDFQPPYETIEAAVSYRNPFWRDGGLCIFGDNFHSWLLMHRHESLTSRELGSMLRKQGWDLKTIAVQIQKKRTSRSVWVTQFERPTADIEC